MSSGGAGFNYHGQTPTTDTSQDVYQIRRGSKAIVVIRNRAFNNFVNFEGNCSGIYHYLFLSNGEQCIVFEKTRHSNIKFYSNCCVNKTMTICT